MTQNEINKMYAIEEAFHDLESGELTPRGYEILMARIEEDNQTTTINNILYRVGVNHYAEYYSKKGWRTSASVTNDVILDKLNKIGRI